MAKRRPNLPKKGTPAKAASAAAPVSTDFRELGGGSGQEAKRAFRDLQEVITEQVRKPADAPLVNTQILLCSYACMQRAPGFATMNYDLSISLAKVQKSVANYVEKRLFTRPLNFLVLAAPGSGKSQLIKSVAKGVGKVEFVPFNMASMRSSDDLGIALDKARNAIVEEKIPLVFLDEFDSNDANYSLLLPLLWDGEMLVDGRDLKLRRCVFFLAGSRASLPDHLNEARNLEETVGRGRKDSKLVDLFSRINGEVIEIPSLASNKFDSQAEKVVVAMALLRLRFAKCKFVPWGFLQFIARVTWRYESRSIATLIDLLAMGMTESLDRVERITPRHLRRLPLAKPGELKESTLGFHLLHPHSEKGVSDLWNQSLKNSFVQQLREERLDGLTGEPLLLLLDDLIDRMRDVGKTKGIVLVPVSAS